jgi:hypothetical protein
LIEIEISLSSASLTPLPFTHTFHLPYIPPFLIFQLLFICKTKAIASSVSRSFAGAPDTSSDPQSIEAQEADVGGSLAEAVVEGEVKPSRKKKKGKPQEAPAKITGGYTAVGVAGEMGKGEGTVEVPVRESPLEDIRGDTAVVARGPGGGRGRGKVPTTEPPGESIRGDTAVVAGRTGNGEVPTEEPPVESIGRATAVVARGTGGGKGTGEVPIMKSVTVDGVLTKLEVFEDKAQGPSALVKARGSPVNKKERKEKKARGEKAGKDPRRTGKLESDGGKGRCRGSKRKHSQRRNGKKDRDGGNGLGRGSAKK